jgi:hypothetical protein
MRTTVAIVLLGLIAGSLGSYVIKKAHPFKLDIDAVEKEVPAANVVSFSDILNLFQAETLENGAKDRLTEFLDGLKTKLQNEHQQHLELYTQQRQQCDEEFAFRNGEINDAQASLEASNNHRSLAENDKEKKENLKDLAVNALSIYGAQLEALDVSRAGQVAIYKLHSANLADSLRNIEVALDYLNEFELEAQGIIPSTFVQIINALLAVSVKTGHTHKVLPIYNKLLQAHSNRKTLDLNDIAELREKIVTLKSNIQEANIELEAEEANNKAVYESNRASLVAVIDDLNAQIATYNTVISKLQDIITQEISIETMAQGKIVRNTDLLAQAHAVCDDADVEFQQAERARTTQIELLGQLENAIATLEAEYEDSLFPEVGTLVKLEA